MWFRAQSAQHREVVAASEISTRPGEIIFLVQGNWDKFRKNYKIISLSKQLHDLHG
jgi:hypothetical protein